MEMAEIVERGPRRGGGGPEDHDRVTRAEIDTFLQLMKIRNPLHERGAVRVLY